MTRKGTERDLRAKLDARRPDDLIREIEAAAILRVSQQRVNQLRAEGKLSVVEVSGMGHTRILYRRSEVERLRVERGVGR